MGLFSSKKKTKVFTSVSRVVKDAQLPNLVKQSLINSIMGGGQITDNLVEEALNSPSLKIDRMFEYARKEYPFGLPNATIANNKGHAATVQAAIEAEIGYPVTLEYAEFAPLHPTHAGWQILTDQYDYDRVSNEIHRLSTEIGFHVYLDDLVPVFGVPANTAPEPGNYEPWGHPATSGWTPERRGMDMALMNRVLHSAFETLEQEADAVRIKYIYQDAQGALQRGERFHLLDGYTADEYFQAAYRYTPEDGIERYGYWTYADDSGVHPAVDALYQLDYTNPGTYFPFVFFRRNRINRTAEEYRDTAEYKSTTKLLKYLGMDYQAMGDTIHENPDIGEIQQAVMLMAVPAGSQDPDELRYLYAFFDRLASQTLPGSNGRLQAMRSGNAIVIQDADFKVTLSYSHIERRRKAGQLGRPGSCYGSHGAFTQEHSYVQLIDGARVTIKVPITVPQHRYRKQLDTHFYDEIVVDNLQLRYHVYKKYDTLADLNNDNLLIPLDKSLTDRLNLIQKEQLYFRSLHIVCNARVVYEVKWYEREWFSWFLVVVAVVITIFSFGAGWETIVAALATMTITQIALMLITWVIKQIVIQYAFRLVVQELAEHFGFLAALVVAVVGMGFGINSLGMAQTPAAGMLLAAGTGLKGAVQDFNVDLQQELQKEAQGLDLLIDQRQAELERAQGLLQQEHLLDPLMFVRQEPAVILGESPDDFFQRSVHMGNPGVLGFQNIESFVDISLTLPSIAQTLGGATS